MSRTSERLALLLALALAGCATPVQYQGPIAIEPGLEARMRVLCRADASACPTAASLAAGDHSR